MPKDFKTCVIMQPTFLPWSGYFNLIANSDHFVFLTDAAFQKGSWHNRNQILVSGQKSWITCPVQREPLGTPLDMIKLQDEDRWIKKLLMTMEQSYKKAQFFHDTDFIFSLISQSRGLGLVELNVKLIKEISTALNLETSFSESRELAIKEERSNKLHQIIKTKNCDRYLSPVGSKEYISGDNVLSNTSLVIEFQNYTPAAYNQLNSSVFESHLSIFDVIANLGIQDASRYVHGTLSN